MNKNIVQSGHLMIEMLGVLAIIGVLSVGGLVGYSKAIGRYRVNETINQITHIVQNTRNLFRNQNDLYGGLSFDTVTMSTTNYVNRILADKAKIFPTSIVKNDYKNLFGGDIAFYADGKFTENDGKAFILSFYGIPQEACIELATRDWQSGLGLVAIKITGSRTGYNIQESYIDNCITQQKTGTTIICGKNMPASIGQATSSCDEEKDNRIQWKFY